MGKVYRLGKEIKSQAIWAHSPKKPSVNVANRDEFRWRLK